MLPWGHDIEHMSVSYSHHQTVSEPGRDITRLSMDEAKAAVRPEMRRYRHQTGAPRYTIHRGMGSMQTEREKRD